MSAATDKARFFLEQSVPELKDYERKKIFNKDEIASIVKKRSDFEHKLNARGAQPVDFVRYVQYEMNLDSLTRKRTKRLGIRTAGHSGQRRIFFILDRATRKFHGDLNLWIQYIDYTRKQKAHKKLSMIFTDALRLHPTSAELWVYAAKYSLDDHADMLQARSYMQRGLRFCKSAKVLWIQYAKLELIYVAKLVARQRILGLDEASQRPKPIEDKELDTDADMIALPSITGEDINPSGGDDKAVEEALENLNSTPALTGAIPLAIFDAAMKHFNNDDRFGFDFYEMVSEFHDAPCLHKILDHVVETMRAHQPTSPRTQICYIKFPTAGLSVTSAEFPRAFGGSLTRLKETHLSSALATEVVKWLQSIVETEDLDPSLKKVIVATMRNAERVAAQE
ncbi:RNA-processing protein HAT helix [Penicillium cosmopolitanum]|uniref:RNA-processing protein HAT helix n=1 Tax=Penicillium cosmopolitanum TaxID=1131564 RepID=A0A9W9VMZ9_9EURO|nr:RNA-processing protein HAT helix [Penicillium cosmopolitanum]KAJ5386111.1 RNA-processing protein HAT helix [Penicillium cosmopolitanum]